MNEQLQTESCSQIWHFDINCLIYHLKDKSIISIHVIWQSFAFLCNFFHFVIKMRVLFNKREVKFGVGLLILLIFPSTPVDVTVLQGKLIHYPGCVAVLRLQTLCLICALCSYLFIFVSGISGKSQILFALVFTTRYLDLLTSFISLYNTSMKVRLLPFKQALFVLFVWTLLSLSL